MNSWEFTWLWMARVKQGRESWPLRFGCRGLVAALLLLILPMFHPQGARAEGTGRIALVMLGEDYQKLQKSSIGAKRAADIVEGLQTRGFEVIQAINPANSKARAVMLDFSNKTASADVAIAVLLGHSTATGGQSYFLPVNTELGVATDLFSRGISVSSVAQIVGRAKSGAVFVLMTAPNFAQPVAGLDARPEFAGDVPKNAVVTFSSSAKVPVSRVDAISEQAAEGLAKALQQPSPSLAELVKAAAADAGAVFGTPPDVSLGKPVPPAPPAPAPVAAAPAAPAAPSVDVKAQEEKVRADADKRAREEQARADAAQAELLKAQKAQSDAARAQAEAEKAKAQADAQKAQADAARALAEAEKAKAQADAQRAQAEAARAQAQADMVKAQAEAEKARAEAAARTAAANAPVPPMDEKVLGQRQRQRIQERLRDMSLYTGPIDSIMGPLTREAIMGYQRSKGAAVTGYLTPEQFQALVPDANQN